jgi:glutaredoxin-like protein NrdH
MCVATLEIYGKWIIGNNYRKGGCMGEQKKKVRLYSLSTCPTCKKVKQFLDEHSIQYQLTEVDLLDSGEQWLASKELKKYNPSATYPTVVIEEVILGIDEAGIKKALEME